MAVKIWTGSEWIDVASGKSGPPGPAGNGISSIVLNADYTLTISYTNGTSYTTGSVRGPAGPPGLTVTGAAINGSGHLIVTLSDGSSIDAGNAKGPPGTWSDAPAERVRRIFYGQTTAAAYYTAHGLTAEEGDVYIKIP